MSTSSLPTRRRSRSSLPAARRSQIPRISTRAPSLRPGSTSKATALLALSSLAIEARHLGSPVPQPTDDLDDATRIARALLERGAALLDELQEPEREETLADDAFDDMFDDSAAEATSEATIGDLCFAGLLELRAALRELDSAERPTDRVSAIEAAGRKLRGSLRAVLLLASIGTEAPSELPTNEELESGLAARRAYSALRRGLRRADDDSPVAVLRAIQYGAGALAALAASSDYAKLVESDRATLRELRDRSLAWARGQRAVGEGLLLLEDLHTTADLLRTINDRRELRAHDRAIVAKLDAATTNDDRYALAMALAGRDDELDVLLGKLGTTSDFDMVWSLVVLRALALG